MIGRKLAFGLMLVGGLLLANRATAGGFFPFTPSREILGAGVEITFKSPIGTIYKITNESIYKDPNSYTVIKGIEVSRIT